MMQTWTKNSPMGYERVDYYVKEAAKDGSLQFGTEKMWQDAVNKAIDAQPAHPELISALENMAPKRQMSEAAYAVKNLRGKANIDVVVQHLVETDLDAHKIITKAIETGGVREGTAEQWRAALERNPRELDHLNKAMAEDAKEAGAGSVDLYGLTHLNGEELVRWTRQFIAKNPETGPRHVESIIKNGDMAKGAEPYLRQVLGEVQEDAAAHARFLRTQETAFQRFTNLIKSWFPRTDTTGQDGVKPIQKISASEEPAPEARPAAERRGSNIDLAERGQGAGI